MEANNFLNQKKIKEFSPAYLCVVILTFFLTVCSSAQLQQSRFDSLIKQYEQLNWNGVLLIGNKHKITYSATLGYSNRETRVPMQLNTAFKTESVGKMFTAIRILQLIEAGKLSLSSTVAKLLPDWKIPNADKMTIQHLLTHTSGLSSQWEHPAYEFGRIYSQAELKKIIEEAPVIFNTPGERSYYSNSGYVLLEEIIANTDNTSFEQSIKDNIFSIAGMRHTRSLNDSVLPSNAARPYYQITDKRFTPDDTKYGDGKASGAGGWISTAEDLFLFAQAYLNEKLLPRKWMEIQLTNNHTIDSSSPYRRLGMAVLKDRPEKTFIAGHNGGGKGFTIDVYFDYYKGDIVVWCSNQYGAAYELTARAFAILNNKRYDKPIHPDRIRLADWLLKQPANDIPVITDPVLSQLNIKTANEFLFFSVFDNLTLVHEHRAARAVIRAGRERFPSTVYMWIKSGENAMQLNEGTEAKKYFEKAYLLAEEKKDNALMTVIKQKLAACQK
jgi:CubicO group peptidase (beta-lactamase class C family)